MSKIILGTDLKFSIKVDPIEVEGQTEKLSLKDCNFEVEMFVDLDNKVTIPKNKATYKSDNEYYVGFNTSEVGVGRLKCRVIIHLDDDVFEDRERTEIIEIDTGLKIVESIVK